MAGLQKSWEILCTTLIFAIICILPHADADRLNVPRVLLPVFNDFPVNFTLEVTEGGCYRWTPSRTDIIRLIPIKEDFDHSCSTKVVVQTVTRDPSRKTTIIFAEDVNTGNVLRCDVIVDAIFELKIVTTTRELFIEEAPELFEVRAYDEQGNEFTTLAGVEFDWEIGYIEKKGSQVNTLPNNVLQFITFQESEYETPHSVEMLDINGKTGNIVLLEGVKTGTAKVSVRLLYPEYKHVPSVEVELIVMANLIIIPSDVTMMPFDSFTYRVVQVHQGRLEEIHIPSSQYYLEAENPKILEINNIKSNAYALMGGKTKVLLHDKNVHEEYSVILPTATVRVSEVAYITIAALPHRSRSLILGFTHEIVVELFDSKDHKFYIGEGVEVTMKISDKYFDKKLTTQNGTHVVAVPTSTGTTTVEATLHGVINKKGKRIPINPELHARVELVIHTAVTIYPRVLALPWDPKVKTRYDVALKASGGDGSYSWNSRQPSIVSVSQNGALKILQKGTADIIVSLVRNVHNRDVAKVHILVPAKLEIVQYQMEAAVGEKIHLHIALFGELHDGSETRLIPFNDCQDLTFEVDIPDGTFLEADSADVEPVGIACATVSIVSQTIGISKVSVTYGKNLTDNVTVSAYEPLVVVNPKTETVLTVGSSRNIIFRGGPQSWSGTEQGYWKETRVSNDNILEVVKEESAYEEEISVFKVLCKALGEGHVTYTVYNKPLLPSCKIREAIATIKVICAKPRYIYLQPEFKDGKNCPISQDTKRIVAHSEETLQMLVIVKDENERRFDNITSLNIEWNVKPPASATIEIPIGSLEEIYYEYNVALPKNHYQQLIPKKYIDSLTLTAKIIGYQKIMLSRLRISPEYPPFPIENERGNLVTPLIEASINISLVNDTVIKPKKLKILNDPNSKHYLQVSQGSGYYDLILSNEDIADVRYIDVTRTISIVPRKSGTLEIALVDLCLSSRPAQVEIEVQQLANFEVETVNKVEKDKFIVAKLQLYDTNGYLMMLPALDALDIKIETENGYIDVKRAPVKAQGQVPYDSILYLIYGLEEGEAQLVFSSGQGLNQIRSEVLLIQVFPPLQLLPKNLTTLVGTIYQISVIGGPKNAEIEFSTDNEEVLEIDASGVIEGKTTGETTIFAKALGEDSKGKKVVFSQDHALVRVILLEGVKIVVPTLRIKVGSVIPVWAFGIPDHLTPLVIGSMKSPLVFSWTTSDPKIMTLHNMYEGTGINVRYQNEVTLRAKANKPGIATIILTVTTPCNVLGGCRVQPSFSSSVKVEIFEELRLINEDTSAISLTLIMAPNSSIKLETNRDKYGSSTYKVLTSGQAGSGESDDPHALTPISNIITVDKNGVLKSGEHYGTAIVTVTNVEAYGSKQTLTIAVYIKPIHYVMLSLKSNIRIRSGEELTMLPKSMDLNYVLEYYDNVGSKFHAAEVDFKTLSSRTDLVTFTKQDQNIVNAKFIENGEFIVKVFNEKYPNAMFDYVHMIIGDVLFPTKTVLTVGDVVCFSMPLLSSDGDPGFWQSSAPEVLYVEPISGIGRARSPGIARVKHSIATQLRDEVEVIVNPINKLTLVPLKGKNVTGMEVFSVPLILKGKHELIKENNILSRGLGGCRTHSSYTLSHYPFICTIQFTPLHSSVGVKDIFYAKPRFDIVTGFYYCDIIPMGLPSVMSSTLETKLRINALSRDIEGTPIEVSYLPPMYIPTREIIFLSSLGQEVPTATLDIYGLPHVLEHIIIETPEEVSVGAQQFLTKNVAQFKLSLTQNQDEVTGRKIIITNELTRQNVSLLIRVPKYDQFPRISGIHWVDYLYFHRYTLGTFVILTISFFHFWRNKMTNIDMSVKNKNVFAEKCSPPLKKTTPGNTSMNNASNSSSPGSPGSPLRPFSAFEPVYGDPRTLFTPNARRNRTCL